MNQAPDMDMVELTTEIVAAYVAHNSLPAGELPGLMRSVHDALGRISAGNVEDTQPEPVTLVPAVPIRKSVTDDYLISLESGQRFKSLKRHLMTTYNMTPQQYRAKWGLPDDYPMVAPGYSKKRSDLALSLGLGRKAGERMPFLQSNQ